MLIPVINYEFTFKNLKKLKPDPFVAFENLGLLNITILSRKQNIFFEKKENNKLKVIQNIFIISGLLKFLSSTCNLQNLIII